MPEQTSGPSGGTSSYPSCASTANDCGCSYAGCMDPSMQGYDANATCDDGSCTSWVGGCMTAGSLNYNSLATQDDGSCIAPVQGCQDPNAYNYNSQANTGCGTSGTTPPTTPAPPMNFDGYSNMRGTDWQRQGQALASGTDWQDVNLNACGSCGA